MLRLANRIVAFPLTCLDQGSTIFGQNVSSSFFFFIKSTHKSNFISRNIPYIEKMVPLREMPCCQSILSIGSTLPDIRFKIDTLGRGDFVSPPFLLCEMVSALQWGKPHEILQRD